MKRNKLCKDTDKPEISYLCIMITGVTKIINGEKILFLPPVEPKWRPKKRRKAKSFFKRLKRL